MNQPTSPKTRRVGGLQRNDSSAGGRNIRRTPHAPRGVKFVSAARDDAIDDEAGLRSTVISPGGSFLATEHEMNKLLTHVGGSLHEPADLHRFRLTRADVEAAFEFLDVNGSGLLTMANLKQRLSAFFPQMTSREYKFLVEDPGGNGNQSVAALQNQSFTIDMVAGSGSPPPASGRDGRSAANYGDATADGAGIGADSRAYGSRAGLDVEQLWDLIESFQRLQHNLNYGGSSGTEMLHRSVASAAGHGRRTGNSSLAYEASIAASIVNGAGDSSSADGVFDAVSEAFRIYDPRGTHYVDEEVLSRIMAQIGFGELTVEELKLLVATADADDDGRISLEDFRRLVVTKGRFTGAEQDYM